MAYIGKRPVDTFPAINAVTSTLIAENNITARTIAATTLDGTEIEVEELIKKLSSGVLIAEF